MGRCPDSQRSGNTVWLIRFSISPVAAHRFPASFRKPWICADGCSLRPAHDPVAHRRLPTATAIGTQRQPGTAAGLRRTLCHRGRWRRSLQSRWRLDSQSCRRCATSAVRFWCSKAMIHLIGFTPDSPQSQVFESLYREGDICVFSDAGLLFASRLSLQGDGYLLQHPALALPETALCRLSTMPGCWSWSPNMALVPVGIDITLTRSTLLATCTPAGHLRG